MSPERQTASYCMNMLNNIGTQLLNIVQTLEELAPVIIEEKPVEKGETAIQISEKLGIKESTVMKLYREEKVRGHAVDKNNIIFFYNEVLEDIKEINTRLKYKNKPEPVLKGFSKLDSYKSKKII